MDEDEIRIATFLEENSSLFTLLSVFGAIAIYFVQFPIASGTRWQNLGTVSALFLFFITGMSIRANLKREINGTLFDYLIKPRRSSYKLALLVVPFYMLVLSILAIVIQFSGAVVFIIQIVLVFVGISCVLWFIGFVKTWRGEYDATIGIEAEALVFARHLAYIGLLASLFSAILLYRLNSAYGYGFQELLKFVPGPGIVPFLFSLAAGILIGGILYIGLSLMVVVLHYIISYLHEHDVLEEYSEFHQALFGSGSDEES